MLQGIDQQGTNASQLIDDGLVVTSCSGFSFHIAPRSEIRRSWDALSTKSKIVGV